MNNDFPFSNFLKITPEDNNLSNEISNIEVNTSNAYDYGMLTDAKDQEKNNSENINEIKSIEKELLIYLKSCLTPQKYSVYFENTFVLKSIEPNCINFSVTTNFIKNIIETHYLKNLEESIVITLGKKYGINIIVSATLDSLSSNDKNILKSIGSGIIINPAKEVEPNGLNPSTKNATFSLDLTPSQNDLIADAESKLIKHMDTNNSNIAIDTKKTFASFIVGHSNNIAYASAMAVSEKPGKLGEYPSLYIHSNSGLGKTHLLHGIANSITYKYPNLRICIMTGREFMNEFVNAIRSKDETNNITQFRHKYSENVDVLMIDDIHELKGKKGTQDEFFHIFNELHGRGKQLVFTSDQHPTEIDGIEERIVSRLQWGLCVDIQQPDLETRIAILKRKAQELDLFLSDDIFHLIATSIKKNIRALEGSLVHLHAFSSFMKTELDIELVKQALQLNNMTEPEEITLDRVAKIVAKYFKFTVADLKSKTRKKELVRIRHVAMYLSQKMADATLSEIGNFYGGRDHSTVISGVKNIEDKLKLDLELSKDIVTLENSL